MAKNSVAPSATDPHHDPADTENDDVEANAETEDEGIRATIEAAMQDDVDADEPASDDDGKPDGDEPASDDDGKPDGDEPTEQQATDGPPMDWGAEEREHWGALPDAVKKRVLDRDAQVNKMLNEGAQSRKVGEELTRLAQPYAPILAAEGVKHPLEAFNNMLGMVSVLRTGAPTQKAQALANLIQHYDVDIETLDDVLAGNAESLNARAAQQNQNTDIQGLVNNAVQQHMQPIYQKQANNVDKMLADFAANNEFYNDVAPIMADLFDIAAKQGRTLTMQQAYDTAVMSNEGIQKVLAERKLTGDTQSAAERAAKKQAASSSIAPGTTLEAPKTDDTSIRGTLTRAMQDQMEA